MDGALTVRWGLVLSILSAIFTSSGLCLQKLCARKSKVDPTSNHDKLYFLGMLYVCVGLMIKTVIYVILPQLVIGILSSQTIIYTTVFESIVLSCEVNYQIGGCLLLIVLGIGLSLYGMVIEEVNHTFPELLNIFLSYDTLLFFLCAAAIMMIMRFYVAQYDMSSGTSAFGLPVRFFAAVFRAGLVAGVCGTVAKALAEVSYTYYGAMETDSNYSQEVSLKGFAVLIPITVCLFLVKAQVVKSALTDHPPTSFLPAYQCATVAFNVGCGMVLFREYGMVHSFHFFVGILLVIGGISRMTNKFVPVDDILVQSESELLGDDAPLLSSGKLELGSDNLDESAEEPFIVLSSGYRGGDVEQFNRYNPYGTELPNVHELYNDPAINRLTADQRQKLAMYTKASKKAVVSANAARHVLAATNGLQVGGRMGPVASPYVDKPWESDVGTCVHTEKTITKTLFNDDGDNSTASSSTTLKSGLLKGVANAAQTANQPRPAPTYGSSSLDIAL